MHIFFYSFENYDDRNRNLNYDIFPPFRRWEKCSINLKQGIMQNLSSIVQIRYQTWMLLIDNLVMTFI